MCHIIPLMERYVGEKNYARNSANLTCGFSKHIFSGEGVGSGTYKGPIGSGHRVFNCFIF